MVKTRNPSTSSAWRSRRCPRSTAPLNAIQRTSWQINRRVLDVMQASAEADNGLGKLPTFTEEPVPHSYPDGCQDREVLGTSGASRRSRSTRPTANSSLAASPVLRRCGWPTSSRMKMQSISRTTSTSAAGSTHAPISYASRRRLLQGPAPVWQGKELGERGAAWLAVHGANLWGYDKVDLDGRIDWVEDLTGNLSLPRLKTPLGHKWWADADKPWQFLAFCFEWAGYLPRETPSSPASHRSRRLLQWPAELLDDAPG
jgi:DNA-directed RNA polymerase